MDMSRQWCSAKPRKRGTGYGTIAGRAPGFAAAAAGSPREDADLPASDFFCRHARRNGGARDSASLPPRGRTDPARLTRRCSRGRRAHLPARFASSAAVLPSLRRASMRTRAAAHPAPRPPRGGTGRRRAPARPAGAASGAGLLPLARNARDSFSRTAGAPPGGRPPRRARPARRPKLRGRSVDSAANKSGAREFRTWDKVKHLCGYV